MEECKVKIAVLGAGNVGATLGQRFDEVGHEVYFGVPNPEKYRDKGLKGTLGTVMQSAKEAEIIVLALPYAAVESALNSCGDITGKIVIDATNPLEFRDGGLHLTIGFNASGGEKIAELAENARVVKCFNTTGFGNMANPRGSMMFVCGNDPQANETVRALSNQIGFETLNIGDISRSRLLEPLAMLWIHLAFTSELKRDFAFSILRGILSL